MATTPLRLWDAVALLALFDNVNQISTVSGNLFIQKITFLAELAGMRDNLRLAHFRFFRFKLGPYSAQLAEGVAKLQKAGALSTARVLTPRGRYVLDYARESIEKSGDATKAMRVLGDIANKHGRKSGDQLRTEIYRMRVPVADFDNQKMLVRDIPHCADILDPVSDFNLSKVDPFDEDTKDELLAELKMPAEVLNRSSESFKRTIIEALSRVETACL